MVRFAPSTSRGCWASARNGRTASRQAARNRMALWMESGIPDYPRAERSMRICVVGAGAIGGFAGASLALGGHDVTFIARGANREALAARGMTLTYEDGRRATARVAATDDFAKAGKFDAVLLAVKAHQLGEVAD